MTEYMDSRRGNRGYGHRSNDHGGRGGQQNFERQPSSYMPKPPAFGYRDRGQSSSFMSSNPPMRSSNRQRTSQVAHIAMVNGQAMVTGQLAQNGGPPTCPPNSTNTPDPVNCTGGDWQCSAVPMVPTYVNNNSEWCSAQNPYCSVPAAEYCGKPFATRLSPPPGLRVTSYQQDSYPHSFVPYNCPPATTPPPLMYGPPWIPPQSAPLFVPPRLPRWDSPMHPNVPYMPPVYAMPMTQQWQMDGVTYFSPPAPIYYPGPRENDCVMPESMGEPQAKDGVIPCMECVETVQASDHVIPVESTAGSAQQATNNVAVVSPMPLPQDTECAQQTVQHQQQQTTQSAEDTVPHYQENSPRTVYTVPLHQETSQSPSQTAEFVPSPQETHLSTSAEIVPHHQQMPHCDSSIALPNQLGTPPSPHIQDHETAHQQMSHSNVAPPVGGEETRRLPSSHRAGKTKKYSYAAATTNRLHVQQLMEAIGQIPAPTTDTQPRGCVHWNGRALSQQSAPAVKPENVPETGATVTHTENLPETGATVMHTENPPETGATVTHTENLPETGATVTHTENLPEPANEPATVEEKNVSNQNTDEDLQETLQDPKVGWDENTPSVPGHRVPYFLQTQPGEGKPQPVTLNFKEIFAQSERARLEKLAAMTPIIKDTYVESAAVARMTGEEAESFRAMKNGIKVHYIDVAELTPSIIVSTNTDPAPSGPKIPIPNPIRTFEEGFSMYPEIMQEIAKQGFTEPSPIQCQLWPCAMKGMDVVGIAQTGSGKTLAFLLPAMIHIQRQTTPREQRKSPTVLVLAPTRELAQQIDREVKKYSYKNIRSVCLYGGASRGEQIDALSIQTEIVIATPGRLNDLVQAGMLNLSEVSFLVLDEADEMLDSGFEPQINKALLLVRGDRQTVLTSATWPESVRRMAKNYTKDPVMVVVGTTDIRAVESVKQNIIFLDSPDDRFDWIVDFLLKMNKQEKAIIFVGKKSLADHLSSELTLMNISVQCIHGSMCQEDREQAIADMQSGTANILVATDVASRGIDIENVNHVINHQFPKCVEQYVHRIGRTGRAGKLGESHTFIGRKDWSSAKLLIDILEHAKQDVPQELRDMAQRFENRRPGEGRGRGRGRGGFDRQSDGFGFGGNFSGGRGRDMYESARPPRHIETAQPIPAEIFDWGGEPPKIVSEGTEWVESEAESGQSTEWGVGAGYSQSSRGGGGYDQSSGGGGGYDQSSGGGSGYNQSSGGGSGYNQNSGGNVGYNQSSGGGGGYDQSSGEGSGYDQSSGGNVGYNQSSGGGGGYDQSSGGGSGYDQSSGGGGGYDHSSGGGSGYNQSSGGNVGYEQSSGVGYDQSSGGNVGYDQSSGGGHGYDQSSGGNAGYEQSSGGNVGYDQSSGSRGYGQSSGSRGYGQGSGGRGNAGWGRNSGTEWVQGSSRGRVWNRSSDREERPARDWGNRNSGERGRRGGGNWERNSGSGGEEWAAGRGRARGQWNRNAGNQGCRYPN